MKKVVGVLLVLASLGWISKQCSGSSDSGSSVSGDSESSVSDSSTGGYPKACKAACGYEITGSTYDCDGYHCLCVPGEDGESTFEKARKL
jgi:hypothetical protein